MAPRSKASQPISTASMPGATNKLKRKTTTNAEPPVPAVEPPVAETGSTKPAKRAKKTKTPDPVPNDTESTIADTVVSDVTTTTTTTTAPAKKRNKGTKKSQKKKSFRTPSSYVLFSMEHRKTVVDNSPDMTLGDVSKQCGSAWRALSETDRKPWVDKAAVIKQQRALEIEEIIKNEPPKKKRTPSSYLLFAMEHRKAVLQDNAALTIGEVSKLCGAAWKTMDDTTKQTWKDKAEALKTT